MRFANRHATQYRQPWLEIVAVGDIDCSESTDITDAECKIIFILANGATPSPVAIRSGYIQ